MIFSIFARNEPYRPETKSKKCNFLFFDFLFSVLGHPEKGVVYKPVQQDPKGLHELFFYMKAIHGKTPSLQALRPFLSYMEPHIFVESLDKEAGLKFTGERMISTCIAFHMQMLLIS